MNQQDFYTAQEQLWPIILPSAIKNSNLLV